MFNIGPEELLLILVIALIFVGPKKLPDLARQVGKGLREFRSITSNARQELMDSVTIDLDAKPGPTDGVEQGEFTVGDDTPGDVGSLPAWDSTQDQPPMPEGTAPAVAAAPSNGNGTKAAGQGGTSRKKAGVAEPKGAGAPAAEPAAGADGAPQDDQTVPLQVTPPAGHAADDAPGDDTQATAVPTTDQVEP